jgi:signal transduction histidine kinase
VLEAQARMRGLDLSLEPAAADVVVQADPDRLHQILYNLIGNAIKFTDQGGSISIGTATDGQDALVHVRDTGRGIAAADLDTIFDPFVQVRTNRSDAPQGVGLGLAISRDLARAMRGDLTVESEPGRGSVFTLRLPSRAG